MSNEKPKGKPRGKPFFSGDQRINRKGRPKDFTGLRAIAQNLANEQSPEGDTTVLEAILRKWITSDNPQLQLRFIEIAFGKVPNPVELSGPDGNAITHEIIVRRGKNIPRPNRATPSTDDSIEGSEAV